MRKTHAMMPLTPQESAVREFLIDRRLSFQNHHVFDLGNRGRFSVDFLIFFGPGIVIECTACSASRGRALSEARRRAAFIDYRFRALKASLPKLVCGALVEAPNEDQTTLARELNRILANADFVVRTNQELRQSLERLLEGGA